MCARKAETDFAIVTYPVLCLSSTHQNFLLAFVQKGLAGEDAGKAKHVRQLSQRLRAARNLDCLHSHRRSRLQVNSQII